MALKDRIIADNTRLYMNTDHYADKHTWNGVSFYAVVDEELALKRKNNNVSDISWDNPSAQAVIHVPTTTFPSRVVANESAFFDGKPVRIISFTEDCGMYAITVMQTDPKKVGLR